MLVLLPKTIRKAFKNQIFTEKKSATPQAKQKNTKTENWSGQNLEDQNAQKPITAAKRELFLV